jgi:ABC-2 type transport system ATP-binding protein
VLVPVTGGSAVLIDALRRLDSEQIAVADVGLRRPTLDDVFLALTGHSANADEPGPAEPTRPTEGAIP